tara:strand:+ start:1677 stop:1925 length:249 start_codon:yes stop_codon:yes gene_type:complete
MTTKQEKETQLKIFKGDRKTYNHAFDVAFSVSGSEYEDSLECLRNEAERVLESLKNRIENIFGSAEYLEAINGWDTYCEQED